MKHFLFLITGLFFGFTASAQKVDTLSVHSPSMKKSVNTIVVSPSNEINLPTVYILHGYSGYPERTLQKDIPSLLELSVKYKMIFVLPDGNYDSWYIDSPISNSKYETFIASELAKFIDLKYETEKSKKAIIGWSMGGHGALYLGLRHPEIFSGIGSICGAIDFIPYGKEYGVTKILGSNQKDWENYTALSQVNKIKKTGQKILISCGINDVFIEQNRRLHETLQNLNVEHYYIETAGMHNADYWSVAAKHQIYLMNEYFRENEKKLL